MGETGPGQACGFSDILTRELDCIDRKRRGSSPGEPPSDPVTEPETNQNRAPLDRAWGGNLVGLALSGGGIRSATFNLGILQSLANLKLLRHLDYLSTVSGGGYIGGWLTALIDRENRRDPEPDEPRHGIERVEQRIATRDKLDDPEDDAVRHLRRYSNYLTPKTGLLTADTWSAVATYLRNLLLNQVILIAALTSILLLPRLVAAVPATWDNADTFTLMLLLTLGVTIWIGKPLGQNLAAFLPAVPGARAEWDGQGQLLWSIVAPLAAGALLASLWMPELASPDSLISKQLADIYGLSHPPDWLIWIALTGLLYGVVWCIAAALAGNGPKEWRLWTRLVITGAIAGLIAGGLHWGIARLLLFSELERPAQLLLRLTFGPPLILAWLYLLAVIHTGLMGNRLQDRQREWLSRLGAWFLIPALGWLALSGLSLFGPLVFDLSGGYLKIAFTSGWILTTLGGLLASRSTPAGGGTRLALHGLLVNLAPYVFVFGLAVVLAAAMNGALRLGVEQFAPPDGLDQYQTSYRQTHNAFMTANDKEAVALEEPVGPVAPGFSEVADASLEWIGATQDPRIILALLVVLLLVTLIVARLIDVNEFSLHRFYGNRLTRCYLGASVDPAERAAKAQPFTGFYAGDDVPLPGRNRSEVTASQGRDGLIMDRPGPIPIVNTAINLVAGNELAWQQRKAASFVLTPLFCGFEPSSTRLAAGKPWIEPCAYRPTDAYASLPRPLSLGIAMATSGAAASPNMGFRTTPALAFLMSVFNIRLGRWVGNPRHRDTWQSTGPDFGLAYLFTEVFGLSRGDTRYVYLSDGGHFENLGIYELVRRRCRLIIACDAGADPDCRLDDLGNAIRKCRTDLGVEIRIDLDQIRPDPGHGRSTWHCAVGDILYGHDAAGSRRGTLVYVKSSLTGDEPEDVLNYAKEHPSFPQQTTGDQFFDEAQFESYRRLGEHVGRTVLEAAAEQARSGDRVNMGHAAMLLRHQWHPPLPLGGKSFTRHTKALRSLFARLQASPQLGFLDAQMYPEWESVQAQLGSGAPPMKARRGRPAPAAPGTGDGYAPGIFALPPNETDFRAGFYFCNSLIQLMEDVYLDLALDDTWNHPDNRGWMNLFKHWSWVGMFRVTWSICAATYGQRFQLFCARRLDLRLGQVRTRHYRFKPAADIVGLSGQARRISRASECRPVFAKLFQDPGGLALNLVELPQVLSQLESASDGATPYSLYQLDLAVEHPQALPGRPGDGEAQREPLFVYTFGYALMEGPRIRLFRVRDHLRKMGLARQALTRLFAEVPDLGIGELPDPGSALGQDFSGTSRRSFLNLFASVEGEVQAQDRQRPAQ